MPLDAPQNFLRGNVPAMSNPRTDRKDDRQKVLVVLGMHRSGTSLVANAVRKLGVATGEELMGPNEFNQSGYGEDIRVVRMHDALLAALDRSWNTVKGTFPLPANWTEKLEFNATREQLAGYLRLEFARAGGKVWAVKDPRMSMLLPLWFRLERDLEFEMVPVFCIRDPDAVAASIEKRDGMPSGLGRLIWLQFNAAVVTRIGNRVKTVLNYDDWFTEPDTNLSRLAAALDHQITDGERSEILDELVSAKLRHHTGSAAAGVFGAWQTLLLRWAKEGQLPPALLQAAKDFHGFLDAFDPWREALTNQDYLTKMIDAREAERRDLVVLAERNLEAFRTVDTQFSAAKVAIKKLEKERDDVRDVADRHFAAYQKIEALVIKLQEQYRDLARRYNLVMNRFDHFPLSLIMPKGARQAPPEKPASGDERTNAP